jgi:hypothetical protein
MTKEEATKKYAENYKSLILKEFCKKAFIKGAEWKIESAWHPANHQPINHFCLLLIEQNDGEFELEYRFDPSKTKRWAYVKDLIPKKED